MSSLASQLQGIASLDAGRLTSRGGYPSSQSYLFPPKDAASHDLDAIFALGISGFEEIVSLDPEFAVFEDVLFSEKAKATDRMMLGAKENAELDAVLGRCLRRLGKWIGIMAGGKCIEWLVRRFRVHEMNAETVLVVFLPYHSSPNFARMLAILNIPTESPFAVPFHPLVKKAQPIPRSYISGVIAPEREKSLRLLNDVAAMLQIALNENVVHRALLAFWAGTMVELLEKSQSSGKGPVEGLVKVLVETFINALSFKNGGKDVSAAVYPPLILLTRSARLADGPFAALLEALLTPNTGADLSQRLLTLLVILNDRKVYSGSLGDNAAERLAAYPELGGLLVAAMEKYGFADALTIIIGVLFDRADLNKAHLLAIAHSSSLPASLARILANKALNLGSAQDTPAVFKEVCKALITALRERHPDVVDASALNVGNLDNGLIERRDDEVALLNALSADVSSRVEGINAILAPLNTSGFKSLPKSEFASIKSTLTARLADSNPEILKALYQTQKHKDTVSAIVGLDAVVEILKPVFTAPTLNDEIVPLHLDFVCNTFGRHASQSQIVFENIIFPALLPTDHCSLSAEAWKAIGQSAIVKHNLFKEIKSVNVTQSASAVELAKNIATATASSDSFGSLVEFFASQLDSSAPRARLLAHLVLIHIIISTQCEKQILAAVTVLRQLQPLFSGQSLSDFDDVDPLSPKLIGLITSKPKSSKTLNRATVALFAALTKVASPSDAQVNWLSDEKSLAKEFAGLVYTWANVDILPVELAKLLLQALFAQLGEETLLFLASVWTSSSNAATLRVAALRHAFAFLKAYTGTDVDFQLIVPTILIALQDENKAVREAACRLPKLISILSTGAANVYALDTIYRDKSGQVQLLKLSDFKRYIDLVASQHALITQDPAQIRKLHTTKLGSHANEGKKDAAHRRAVVGALLSHVAAWRSLSARAILLNTVSGVQDSALFRGVLPLLIAATEDEKKWVEDLPEKEQATYIDSLFGTLTSQSASVLQDNESQGWKFVLGLLSPRSQDAILLRLRSASLARMEGGVFDALFQSFKAEYIEEVLDSLQVVSTDEAFATRAALTRLSLDPPTLVSVLDTLSQPLETSAHRKRQKQDESGDVERSEQAITQLTALIESRNWALIPGNAPLLASLMAILSSLLARRQSVKEGIDYLEQEILGGILTVLEKITDAQDINRAHVGIEVIIKVIRASANPRTSQRGLLVASELARLIPEAVLHNIMPIFTFMGASDFQRDDAYSFGVVEKTVSRIVPVMTRSLRAKANGDKLRLYAESKTFLSIFTDMASRLPRHRTLPFYVHLVKSLGPEDFLAPIAMLLVDRSTVKASRGAVTYAQALELPRSVAAEFAPDTRLEVILDVLREVLRIVADRDGETQTAFLSVSVADSDRVLRQVTALLSFTASLGKTLVGTPTDQSLAEEVVKTLLVLAASVSASSLSTSSVPAAIQTTLGLSMQFLSAAKFLSVVLELLKGGNDRDTAVALAILVERLPLIKSEVRVQSAATISEIIKRTADLVTPTSSVISPCLATLCAIAKTSEDGEKAALASAVPVLVAQVPRLGEVADQVSTLSLLEVSARRLASRVIPFTQQIVDLTLSLPSTSTTLVRQTFALQTALIDVVPTFLGSKQLLSLLRHALSGTEGSRDVISAAARKVPTKTIFPVVMDLWKAIQHGDASSLTAFFDILRLVLRHADRASLPGLIKPVFAFFLDVFDLRHRLRVKGVDPEIVDRVETSSIASFLELVTKLSEAMFKPLFIRLYDWAVIDLSEDKPIDDPRLIERKMVLLHVMKGLLEKFKNILSPYLGTLYPHIKEVLSAFSAGQISAEPLWKLLLDTLATSFNVDEGAYYTDAIHQELVPLLTCQIGLFPSVPTSAETIANALASLAASTTSESILRSLNTSVCMVTRSDEASTRLAALAVLEADWTRQSDEMLQFVPETVSEFLSELLEDENGDVEIAARGVLSKIEAQTGSLKEYLD